jgi:hypothetical protein
MVDSSLVEWEMGETNVMMVPNPQVITGREK